MADDEVRTLKEVGWLGKIAENTAYMVVHRGDLLGLKRGGTWRFERQDVIEEDEKVLLSVDVASMRLGDDA